MKHVKMLLKYFEVSSTNDIKNSDKFKGIVSDIEVKNNVIITGYRATKEGNLFLYSAHYFFEFDCSYGNGLRIARHGIIHHIN